MTQAKPAEQNNINKNDYSIRTLEDEIRVDQQCQTLLKSFHQHLLEDCRIEPLSAGALARGADYFLRDFVIDKLRGNVFLVTAEQVRGFAGNWYIHQALEPDAKELITILQGVAAFYQFCKENRWIDETQAADIEMSCQHLDFYRERMTSFHALTGDDYPLWCRVCPVTP